MTGSALADRCEGESAQRSINGGKSTKIRFKNRRSGAVDVYWLDYQGGGNVITLGSTAAPRPRPVAVKGHNVATAWFANID